MPRFEIIVELKKEVLDAEARAIGESLHRLGYKDLEEIRCSKRFVVDIASSCSRPEERARELAQKFLANPVSESFVVRQQSLDE